MSSQLRSLEGPASELMRLPKPVGILNVFFPFLYEFLFVRVVGTTYTSHPTSPPFLQRLHRAIRRLRLESHRRHGARQTGRTNTSTAPSTTSAQLQHIGPPSTFFLKPCSSPAFADAGVRPAPFCNVLHLPTDTARNSCLYNKLLQYIAFLLRWPCACSISRAIDSQCRPEDAGSWKLTSVLYGRVRLM
jgi:hypothetical protein